MASAASMAAEHHFRQAEKTLATVTALGLDQESAEREVTAALVHALLALTAAVMDRA
jgi:hypothetical protein